MKPCGEPSKAFVSPCRTRGQVFIKGVPQYETTFSDSLLMFLLKANNPDKSKNRREVPKKALSGEIVDW
jgi:hypothetical protein